MSAETIETGSPVVRGSVPFITVKEIGELGDKDKAVFKESGFDRIVAQEERPLASLAIPVMHMLLPLIHHKDQSQFDEDMATLKLYLSRLVYSGPKKTKKSK
jgi:hypothetical protein